MSKTSEILKKFVDRAKTKGDKFSLRSLAKELDISHTYLSRIINGQRSVPLPLLVDLFRLLEIDESNQIQLKAALVDEKLSQVKTQYREEPRAVDDWEFLHEESGTLLDRWYNVALADLVGCKEFQVDPKWISQKLSITEYEAGYAWNSLVEQGYVVFEGGQWRKTNAKIHFPANESKEVIRKFHQQMIRKAMDCLKKLPQDSEFKKRSISGITFTLNNAEVAQIKKELEEVFQKFAAKNSGEKGNCVYQLNWQFFPLSQITDSVDEIR